MLTDKDWRTASMAPAGDTGGADIYVGRTPNSLVTQDTEALTVSPMSVPRGGKGETKSASWSLLRADGGP